MDLLYIPALASFSGSASGTLASIVTNWVTQRRKDRVRHTMRATAQREELYKDFIEEASRLYADALVNDKSEISKLVDLYALIARMKIDGHFPRWGVAESKVDRMAEAVVDLFIAGIAKA